MTEKNPDQAAAPKPEGPKDEGDDYGSELPLTTYDPDEEGERLPDPRGERGDAV